MTKKQNAFAVIMAGGRGERFWPQSRLSRPKQLLRLLGNLTLIEQTIERLTPVFEYRNIVIVTNRTYSGSMRKLLPKIPPENIIGEPCGKDTAPCMATAGAYVRTIAGHPDPVMCFLPADHIINDRETFASQMRDAIDAASTGEIVTMGITPDAPLTGYGYIQVGERADVGGASTEFRRSLAFKEKPTAGTAEAYLTDGSYKWNGGIFIMSVSSLRKAFAEYAPELAVAMEKIEVLFKASPDADIAPVYNSLKAISFDYAVMEKASNILVATAAFDWDDVGSWTSMRNQIKAGDDNNVVRGLFQGLNAKDCIVIGDSSHLVTAIDVKDLVIVHTPDATLVCNAKSAQRVKELVNILAAKNEFANFI